MMRTYAIVEFDGRANACTGPVGALLRPWQPARGARVTSTEAPGACARRIMLASSRTARVSREAMPASKSEMSWNTHSFISN